MGVTSKTCLLHHKLDQYQQASLCLQGLQTPPLTETTLHFRFLSNYASFFHANLDTKYIRKRKRKVKRFGLKIISILLMVCIFSECHKNERGQIFHQDSA